MTKPMHVSLQDPAPLVRVGDRYRLLRQLGRGGMAVVHEAHDEVLDRTVAVKLLHPHLTDDPRVLDRFRREAQAAAALQHPGVVAVHDWGIDDGVPYLVMEHVGGRSLRSVLDLRGRLRPGEALSLLGPAVAGLAAAHEAGIVHRDVTPSNVLLTTDGASKLGDFGLARSVAATSATFAGTIVGSPHYLSPEATRGAPLDARADVYSLGCVLFECLTGQRPFDGDSPIAVAARHGVDNVPAPSTLAPGIPAALDALVVAATAHDPDARPQNANDFGVLFSSAIPGGPIPVDLRDGSTSVVVLPEHATRTLGDLTATTVLPGVTPRQPRRKVRWKRLLGLLVTFAMLGGGGYVAWDRVLAPVTDVPSVVGLQQSDARELLEGLGFVVAVAPEPVNDRTIVEGAVVQQSVDTQARQRSTIELVLSAGPRTASLPPLVGRTAVDARAALEELGLDLTITITDTYDDVEPVGRVLAADPSGGAIIIEGSEVTLFVSAGPAPVKIPAVLGMLEGAATAELVGLGLTVRVTERRFDDSPAGTVIAVAPREGRNARRGDEVTMVVSEGPEPVAVPDVVGMRESQAIVTLENVGFVVDVRYVKSLLPFSAGIVHEQDPSPGTTRPRGETLRIFVWD